MLKGKKALRAKRQREREGEKQKVEKQKTLCNYLHGVCYVCVCKRACVCVSLCLCGVRE